MTRTLLAALAAILVAAVFAAAEPIGTGVFSTGSVLPPDGVGVQPPDPDPETPPADPPAGEAPAGEPPASEEPEPGAAEATEPPADAAGAQEARAADAKGAVPGRETPAYRGPTGAWFSFEIVGYDPALALVRSTAVGRLFEEPEMKKARELVERRYREQRAAADELIELADDLDIEIEAEAQAARWMQEMDEVRHAGVRFHLYPPLDPDAEDPLPRMLASVLLEEAEVEKAREMMEHFEKVLDEIGELETIDSDRKIRGHDVMEWSLTVNERPVSFATLIEGREVYTAINDPSLLDALEPGPDVALDEVFGELFDNGAPLGVLRVDMTEILEFVTRDVDVEQRERFDRVFSLLGLTSLRSIQAGLDVEGPDFRETILLELAESGEGLLAALRPFPEEGAGTPPPLPAFDPSLMAIHGSLDLDKVEKPLADLAKWFRKSVSDGDAAAEGDEAAGDEQAEAAAAELEATRAEIARFVEAFDGGISFLVASPSSPFLPIPRLVLAARIGDREAFDTLLRETREGMEGIEFEEQEYKDVTLTTVRIPNNPSPLVPSFAAVDGALYLADSPMNLRNVVTSLLEKKTAPVPAATGANVLTCDYDTRQVFRLLYEKVLPLAQLGLTQMQRMTGSFGEPLLDFAELPTPEVIGKHLGDGKASISWVGGGLRMTARSALGDPILSSVASIYGPLLPAIMGFALETERSMWEQRVVRARIARIHEALKLHRATFGAGKRFPSSLGDLLSRGLVEDEELFLVPSDEDPASVEYETIDGDIAEVPASYKYLPDSKLVVPRKELRNQFPFTFDNLEIKEIQGVAVDAEEIKRRLEEAQKKDEVTILLYELNANRHGGRFVLTTDGGIHHLDENRFQELISLE